MAMTPGRGNPRRVTATIATPAAHQNPWSALGATMIGALMVLVNATIVAVANPSIMIQLGTGYGTVTWVTSAYLLGWAVPLLMASRLGDRCGPKPVYLIGLGLFTAASLACGLSGTVAALIAARAVQGVGAALLTPQTFVMITRIFPPQQRGAAFGMWGAVAGFAALAGPLIGGVLIAELGWEWIFFVNIPVGVLGLVLAVRLIPALPTHISQRLHACRFDPVGVGLSGLGMFLLVYALQDGQAAGWAPWIWAVLVAGVGLLWAFVYWQSISVRQPLLALTIFCDRAFALTSFGAAMTSFVMTTTIAPVMFYLQMACSLSPLRSALVAAPMAGMNGLLARPVGKIVDSYPPRAVLGFGFSMLAIALTWLSLEMTPDTPIWRLALPLAALGAAMAFLWSPLAATAIRNLPAGLAGAGSIAYNAGRLLGAVLGSAGMAAFMTWRIAAETTSVRGHAEPPVGGAGQGSVLQLPEALREPFAAAMSQSMLLPSFGAVCGIGAVLFMVAAQRMPTKPARRGGEAEADDGYDVYGDYDDYVEVVLTREPDNPVQPKISPTCGQERNAEPLSAGVAHRRAGHARASRSTTSELRLGMPDRRRPDGSARHRAKVGPSVNKHHRVEPADSVPEGRHSLRTDGS